MANEFIIRKGYKSLSDSEITGSLNVSTDVTSSDVSINDWGSVSASLGSITSNVTNNKSNLDSLNAATSSYLLNTTDTLTGNLTVTNAVTASSAQIANLNYPTTDGTDGQALVTDGAGGLTFGFPTNADDAEKVTFEVQNGSGVTLAKGTPIHISSSVGSNSIVIAASASDASTMPAHGILNQQLTAGSDGVATIIGQITGVNTSAFSAGDTIYVAADGGYTNVKPQGSGNLVQNLGIVKKVDASNGTGEIYGSGRSNDVPNLPVGKVWVGSSTYSVTSSLIHLDESNGRLGLGNTAPTNELTVEGSISASGDLHINNNQGLVSKNVAGADRTLIELDNTNTLRIKGDDSEGSANTITMVAGGDVNFPADVTVQGTLTAQEFHTEYVSASIVFNSGSTKFGDTSDDNHDFTGSVNLSGALTGTSATFSGDVTLTTGNLILPSNGDILSTGNIRITSDSNNSGVGDVILYAGGFGGANEALKVYASDLSTELFGTLSGTSATFSSSGGVTSQNTGGNAHMYVDRTDGATVNILSATTAGAIRTTTNHVIAIGANGGTGIIIDTSNNTTINGTLSGTSATFSDTVTSTKRNTINSNATLNPSIYLRNSGATQSSGTNTKGIIFTNMSEGVAIQGNTTGIDAGTYTPHLLVNNSGNTILTGTLTGTSATFSGLVQLDSEGLQINRTGPEEAYIVWDRLGTTDLQIGMDANENAIINNAFGDPILLQVSGSNIVNIGSSEVIVNQALTGTSATFSDDLTITKTGANGDATLSIIADSDNTVESSNPILLLSQDNGGVTATYQLIGNANELATGTESNSLALNYSFTAGVYIIRNSSILAEFNDISTLNTNGLVINRSSGTNGGYVNLLQNGTLNWTLHGGISSRDFRIRNGSGSNALIIPQNLSAFQVQIPLTGTSAIFSGDVDPSVDDTPSLGSSTKRWNSLHSVRLHSDILREKDGTNVFQFTGTTRNLYDTSGSPVANFATTDWSFLVPITGTSATFAGDVLPSTDSSYDLGSTSVRWATIWSDQLTVDNLRLDGNTFSSLSGDITINFSSGDDLFLIGNSTSEVDVFFRNEGGVSAGNDFYRLNFDFSDDEQNINNGAYISSVIDTLGVGTEDIYLELGAMVGGASPTQGLRVYGDGITTPSATITGNISLTGNLEFGSSNGYVNLSRGSFITFYEGGNASHGIGSRNNGGSEADDIRINSYGAVYINLDSNNNNSSGADFIIGRHGGATGTIANNRFKVDGETGAGTFAGDVIAFGSPSDISLKENIKPIEGALDKVKKLQGVTFDWKQNDDDILKIKEDYGFIAQEVQEVLPELVRENENGKLSLRDKGVISVLVEAIKEQQKQIEALKERIDSLENN